MSLTHPAVTHECWTCAYNVLHVPSNLDITLGIDSERDMLVPLALTDLGRGNKARVKWHTSAGHDVRSVGMSS